VTIFTDDAGRTPHGVDWSPDGTRVAFALCPDEMCGELFVAASDGSGTSSVGGAAFEAYQLAWSPDGTTLAFGGRHAGQPLGVYGMTPDGSDVRRIGGIEGGEGSFPGVDWSADGTSIVTHAGTDALGSDIWVIAADGSGEVNLTGSSAGGFLPEASADGAWIAFRDGSTIFLAPAKGGAVRVIGSGEGFAWSPDASMLALERPGGVRFVDVGTGDEIDTVADVAAVDSWQRVAR
jgi:Tol biopolymer transport system component